jgi:hypothetical protein
MICWSLVRVQPPLVTESASDAQRAAGESRRQNINCCECPARKRPVAFFRSSAERFSSLALTLLPGEPRLICGTNRVERRADFLTGQSQLDGAHNSFINLVTNPLLVATC